MKTPEDIVLVKFIANQASKEELNTVEEWIAEDPENLTYLDNLKRLWETREKKYASYEPDFDSAWKNIQSRISETKVIKINAWKSWAYKIAAILVIGLAITFLFYDNQDRQIAKPPVLSWTATDKVREIELSDGSVITLNRGASLTQDESFGVSQRLVKLTGEAFFDIERDESAPFIIETGSAITRVLGTSFNLSAIGPDVIVTVVSGKVSFGLEHTDQEVILEKGEIGRCQMVTAVVTKSENNDPNFLSWKTGKLFFDNQSLARVLADISRHYDIQFQYEQALEQRLTVEFDNQSLDEVLEIISSTIDVNIEQKEAQLFIVR
ncbi:MAG: FecR domain-containing protein [Cyclobacteriaceae bacterium]|nr:FecR domain-containing protein [Cyclobacteriaceae bacterium HetDA_MAG_MS6]